MKKRTVIFTATAALLVVIAVPLAFAQHMHARGEGNGGHHFGSMMMLGHLGHAKQALGLSDQQVTDIKAIFQDLRTQNAPYRQSIKGGIHSIAMTLIANPNDLAAAQALIDQQTGAEKAMKLNALNAASKALNVLTPDQRSKLGTLIAEREAKRQAN